MKKLTRDLLLDIMPVDGSTDGRTTRSISRSADASGGGRAGATRGGRARSGDGGGGGRSDGPGLGGKDVVAGGEIHFRRAGRGCFGSGGDQKVSRGGRGMEGARVAARAAAILPL